MIIVNLIVNILVIQYNIIICFNVDIWNLDPQLLLLSVITAPHFKYLS